ncbi:MAG: CvpA family protein [Candidatus Omnitrophota bacterium]
MLSKYVVGINWVDFLIIGIILRMCYIGLRTGIGIEFFKLLGLWLATMITFQLYSTPLADMLHEKLPALPIDAADVFVFVSLLTITILVVRMIRESFFLLVKLDEQNTASKWGGLVMGFIRGVWIASLALMIMTISTMQYLETSAKSSLFGHRFINIAPQIYEVSHRIIISKLFPKTDINDQVFQVIDR